MKTKLLLIHAISPLHAGTGQSLGPIDLSIARNKTTNLPYLPGSSLKGSLRAEATLSQNNGENSWVQKVFGPESTAGDSFSGTLAVGDAQLLFLPIRSLQGTFAWVTSPMILARYRRDAEAAKLASPKTLPKIQNINHCHLLEEGKKSLAIQEQKGTPTVLFEDLDFQPYVDPICKEWGEHFSNLLFHGYEKENKAFWQEFFKSHFCIIHDDAMNFLASHGTEVVTRNVLEIEKKVTENLWSEENLPSETILYSLLVASGSRGSVDRLTSAETFQKLSELLNGYLQLGGKATVGRGRCKLSSCGGAA